MSQLELLLPCPFCGNTKLFGPNLTDYCGDTYSPSWNISCEECPCDMNVDGESSSRVIDAWNRRTL